MSEVNKCIIIVIFRNLPFDAEEEDVEELFSQFGDMNYCRIVRDPNTDFSRGVPLNIFQI